MTFSVTVFETAFPFFGVTVTVTRHDPGFTPFSVVPLTLQDLAEDDATFSEILEPDGTVIDAYLAMADPVATFFADTTGATETGAAEEPEPAAAVAGAVVAGAEVSGACVDAGDVFCGPTVDGGAVVGAAVVGAAVVGAALVVVAAALVTAKV